ncbi:LysM peptidoglycan-binding domain-containing protein [Arcanobacterium buesumense]|uniref:LysM peptidoglycan-binding domain-containing protein n=1 Tax=Arcanobacterium buesumense TaxID=2722751 RepID=A0A6H2EK24_9ACTO|nr:LysM peptidoglycan-binding domain-containing protein [Arcanobacterium buesumense]QJC21323.1 LysM peptidoglycan-binding domain-containing protein [Arcanobacterium buesumense]
MKYGVPLLFAATTSGWFTYQLLDCGLPTNANSMLELTGLVGLTLIFLWNSLSYLLVDVGTYQKNSTILEYVARFGAPHARRVALAALLLSPTPAYAANTDHSPPAFPSEYGIHVIQHTPDHLRNTHLAPAALKKQIMVKPGDSLWSIAHQLQPQYPHLTPDALANKIWECNKHIITEPNLIYPGQHLLLPDARK